MPEKKEKDWVTPVAVGAGAVGIGVGLALYLKKPPKEVKEGEWAEAGTILARQPFQVTISEEAPPPEGQWLPAYADLSRQRFSVMIEEEAPPPEGWQPAYTELARQSFSTTITKPPVKLITFSVIGTGFPFATRYWTVYYYDPGINDFVGDGIWHGVNDIIYFEQVKTGGYLYAYCLDWTNQISEHKSRIIYPINGRHYEYDLVSGNITRI